MFVSNGSVKAVALAAGIVAGFAGYASAHGNHSGPEGHGYPAHGNGASDARDGDVAVRREFQAAADRDTAEAYRLFIERHPRHPLADRARDLLRRRTRD